MYGHFYRAGKGLEDTFYLMMLVRTLGTDIQIHAGSVAQALEEMEEHLRRHIPYFHHTETPIRWIVNPSATLRATPHNSRLAA